MNTQQLEYFIAVAENKNFTKAAQQCYISQTAISLQIKALEDKIGATLINRGKHHFELTPAGKVYLREAKRILHILNEAERQAKTASLGLEGSITIGFISGYEQSDISSPLRNFHDTFPNISINFKRNNMSILYEQLFQRDCDIAYTLLPYYGNTPEGLHMHFIEKIPLYLVVYPGHAFSERTLCYYSELADEDFIIMQPPGRPLEETEEVMLCRDRGGFIPNIVRRESEIQTIFMEVSIGLGVAIVPEYVIGYFKKSQNLMFVPLVKNDMVPETLDFGICWRDADDNPMIRNYISWMGYGSGLSRKERS